MCSAPVGDGAKRTRGTGLVCGLVMLIGAHVSTGGGLPNTIERGIERDCEAIQIFHQRSCMWRPTAYANYDCAACREAMDASTISSVVIHAVYLINAASKELEIRLKSLT